MDSSRVVLSLGSNRGACVKILLGAIERLSKGLDSVSISRIYISDPLYVRDQDVFYNMAIRGFWKDSPEALLEFCNRIEKDFGRDREQEQRRGARSLDIDILLFGELVLDSERLTIPHALMAERKFALVPLLELEPFARDPRSGTFWSDTLERLPLQGIYYARSIPYNELVLGRA